MSINKHVVFRSVKHERFHHCLPLVKLEGREKLKLLKGILGLLAMFSIEIILQKSLYLSSVTQVVESS